MKKNIREKFKQFALTTFAIILIGIGYINFSMQNEKNEEKLSVEDRNNIGDVELVSSSSTDENDEIEEKNIAENVANTSNYKEEVKDEVSEYYTNSRLERDKMYSQMLESYKKIADNTNISPEQKSIAINEISKITNQKNSIMIAENLIKNKGFEDVLILINENSTSVIVRTENLTLENVAQIQNVVSREVGIEISKINITNKY
ncbi:MAG: SpoIIIAH-like family protein [Candidatus Scatovivens sp.]